VLLDPFQGMEAHERCTKGNRLRGSQQTGMDRVSQGCRQKNFPGGGSNEKKTKK